MKKAKVIYIEGPDGSGKTTLISKLKKVYEKNKKSVYITKEPGGKNTEKIRDILLDPNDNISYITRRLLFLADHIERLDHMTYLIDKYDYIIIDRSAEVSDMVYGHMCSSGRVKPLSKRLYKLMRYICDLAKNEFYMGMFDDSKIVFVNLPEQVLKKRISSRAQLNDLMDRKSMDFKLDIGRKYKDLMRDMKKRDPERIIIYNPMKESLSDLINKIDGGIGTNG